MDKIYDETIFDVIEDFLGVKLSEKNLIKISKLHNNQVIELVERIRFQGYPLKVGHSRNQVVKQCLNFKKIASKQSYYSIELSRLKWIADFSIE
jgi:hypothetical protein